MRRKQHKSTRRSLFSVTPDKDNKKVLHMVEHTWKSRFKKLREHIVQVAAQSTLDELKEHLPSGGDYRDYSDSMSVAQIDGLPVGTTGFAIQSKSKKKSGRTLENDKTIVYVRVRRRAKQVSPEVQVLVDHSPWTLESLPFVPKASDAQLVYRKVTAQAVLSVTRNRRKDKKVWSKALSRKGIRDQGRKNKLRLGTGRVKGVQDMAFTAIGLEFGQSTKAKPHWRPAFSGLKRRTIPNMSKKSEYARAVSDPDFHTWMTWPKKTGKRISARIAQSFVPFQKKLGIKW